MHRSIGASLLLATLCGCVADLPAPISVEPPQYVRRHRPIHTGVLAVLDFIDRRPESERGSHALSDAFSSNRLVPHEDYWYLHGERRGVVPEVAADSTATNLRITGDGAFSWYPFPRSSHQTPDPRPLSRALADYYALVLEQWGAFGEVVRVANLSEAEAGGADYVLAGQIHHFVGWFGERPMTGGNPTGWWEQWDLSSTVSVSMLLFGIEAEEATWEHRSDRVLSKPTVFDGLPQRRGDPLQPLLALDQDEMPELAFRDMVDHVERALTVVTDEFVESMETRFRRTSALQ